MLSRLLSPPFLFQHPFSRWTWVSRFPLVFSSSTCSSHQGGCMQDWCSWSVVLENAAWNQMLQFVCNNEVRRITKQPNLTAIIQSFHIWPYCMYGWWRRCQDYPNGSPSREMEETTRASPYHVAEQWTPSNEIWEPTTLHWMKQSTWPRTVLCGGWCLLMALCTPRGACQ